MEEGKNTSKLIVRRTTFDRINVVQKTKIFECFKKKVFNHVVLPVIMILDCKTKTSRK